MCVQRVGRELKENGENRLGKDGVRMPRLSGPLADSVYVFGIRGDAVPHIFNFSFSRGKGKEGLKQNTETLNDF